MNADDFKTGDRVMDNAYRRGTVMEDDAKRAEYPGFVPIQWDAGARTVALAGILTPIDSRSATPQAGRAQTAGPSTSPQDVPAPSDSERWDVPGKERDGRSGAYENRQFVTVDVGEPEITEAFLRLQNVEHLVLQLLNILLSNSGAKRGITNLRHKSSPSVGAPDCAVCDNPEPTDGETAGTSTSPQDVPAPTQLDRVEALLVDIRNLAADQAAARTLGLARKNDVVGRIGGKRATDDGQSHFENGRRK